jgi:hypothetical protein
MERSVFWCPFDTDEELDHALVVLANHNAETNPDLVGDPIDWAYTAPFVKPYKRRGMVGSRCLMFGHGSGRSKTWIYFRQNGVNAWNDHDNNVEKRLGQRTPFKLCDCDN